MNLKAQPPEPKKNSATERGMDAETALRVRLAEYRRRIPNSGDLPVYKILQRIIQIAISEGDWKPGEAIAPERLFAKLTGASVGTVKKAIGNLVNEGILYRRQGSGTYVASKSLLRHMRRYYLFLNDFYDSEDLNSIVLHSKEIVSATPEINAALKLEPDAQLVRLTRLFRENNGTVSVLTRSHFCRERFAGLARVSAQRFEKVPLYVIIEEDYHLNMSHSDELLGMRIPSAEDAGQLGLPEESPAMYMKSLTYNTGSDTPYEYRESFCKLGGKYIYRCIDYS